MPKYDAVDRLMALATEKRADRLPAAHATEPPVTPPEVIAPSPAPEPSTSDRGRRLIRAIQPLLPAVAGAMRLVDHGAVQAVARLLPLLGGSIGAAALGPSVPAPTSGPDETTRRDLSTLQVKLQEQQRELNTLQLQAAATDDELRRSRTHFERLAAELDGKQAELRALSDRVRMLAAATIILFMLVIAQMILLVVMFHK